MNKHFDAIDTPLANRLGFKQPPHFPTHALNEPNTNLFKQKGRALNHMQAQLQNIYDGFLPTPDSALRKECEALGFIFHDKQTRQLGALIKTSLPKGWQLQMPIITHATESLCLQIIDDYGHARFEVSYNANS